MKILIVEDDETLVKMYTKKFNAEGFEVVAAYTGGEGMVAAGKEMPDCILLDIMMPAVDGFTVIKQLKNDQKTREIPIIILTNLGTSQIFVDEAKRLGAAEYLIKYKTSSQEIIDAVKRAVEKKGQIS